MANIHLIQDSIKRAYRDGSRVEQGKGLVLDMFGKPISNTEIQKERDELSERVKWSKHTFPIGEGWRGYKLKVGEHWRVNWGYEIKIPKMAYPVGIKEYIEIRFGEEALKFNEAKYNWDRIQHSGLAQVTIYTAEPITVDAVHLDDVVQAEKYKDMSKRHVI